MSELHTCSCHHPDAGLLHVAQVIILMIGDVGSLHKHLIMVGCPLEFEIEGGIGTVRDQLARGLSAQIASGCIHIGAAVLHITAHAVLPTHTPGGREAVPDAMMQTGHKLMPQILHGIIALVDLHIVMTFLMDVGIPHTQITHPGVLVEQLGEAETSFCLNAHIVQVEGSTVVGIIGSIHDPVYHLIAPMIESAQGALESGSGILDTHLQRTVMLRLQALIAIVGRTLVIELGERRQAEALVVRGIQLPSCSWPVGDVHTGIEPILMIHAGGHIGHHTCRDGPSGEEDVVFQIV